MKDGCVPSTLLAARCDAATLPFSTTAELDPPTTPLGQSRAVEALGFFVNQLRYGYNVVVIGPSGHGKHALVQATLREAASIGDVPCDWCYVHDFRAPQAPKALRLPPGRGRSFASDVDKLIEELRVAIPAAFESEYFRTRLSEIHELLKDRPEQLFREVEQEAKRADVAMIRLPTGVAFAPIKNGEVLPPDQYEQLSEEEKRRIQGRIEELQDRLQKGLRDLPRWAKRAREDMSALTREVTRSAVDQIVDDVALRYTDLPQVSAYLNDVRADVVEHVDDFRKDDEEKSFLVEVAGRKQFLRYRVNLLVDHSQIRGAPVVYEDRPALDRLVGRVEHRAELGALVSDFTLIKPGALHAANGGYLILDMQKLLGYPHAWESLKRALFSRELRIESLSHALGLAGTATLEPEPIPLNVKVVVIGDPLLHHLLSEVDPDVSELFRVVAEFDDRVPRTPENQILFARELAGMVRAGSLRPLDRSAVARVIDHAARLAGDTRELSTSWRDLETVLDEADHSVKQRGGEVVTAEDIARAIETRVHRRDILQKRIQEAILRGTLLVDSDGERVGQVNGLSVVEIGGIPFSWPTRITATTRVGEGKVVDIEREVELGGAVHSKGVLILSSYFASRYTRQIPLSLSASLVFEQSYGGIEGDSASLAELCALLSSLADVPIRQAVAVTGSVNQLGQVQAIGGVNDKIEGFFEICDARGLTGEQGVVIPASNVPHLMLRDDVVAACERGLFHVWAVETVDDAIELLTGVQAGVADEQGEFPEESLNGKALQQLLSFAVIAEGFRKFVKVEGQDDQAGCDA